MNELILSVMGIVSAAFSGFLGWFFGRRQSNADAVGTEIDNGIKLADYYKKIADDLEPQYQKKFDDLAKMYEAKEKVLKDEIALLKRQALTLRKEIKYMDTQIKDRDKKIKELTNLKFGA